MPSSTGIHIVLSFYLATGLCDELIFIIVTILKSHIFNSIISMLVYEVGVCKRLK